MPPKPELHILTPDDGCEIVDSAQGDIKSGVQIYGDHLLGTAEVTFNGISAAFRILNVHTILAMVPPGATSGPIEVTHAGGKTSTSQNFIVD
jgi:hypothetical protein